MKKLTSIVLSIVILLTFVFLAIASGDEKPDDNQGVEGVGKTTANSNLGDYKVEIKSARMTKDYSGDDVIVITYNFTNNSKKDSAFFTAFEDKVYQEGIGLNGAYILKEGDPYSADNQTKNIKTGTSLDVDVAYTLNDKTTDVDVEVGEFFSFNDTLVKKTFKISK